MPVYTLRNNKTDDEIIIELQKKHEEYLEKIKAFINDVIEQSGRSSF